jgi:Protein of unknown function (DUF3011)
VKPSLWMVLAAVSLSALPVGAQTASPASTPSPRSRLLRCGTDSSQRVLCAAGGEIASARLVRDLSSGKCGSAGSWGWTRNAVWSDNGCRGDFSVTYGGTSDTLTRRISCGTLSSRRDECSAHGVVDSVRLVKRSFFSRCEEGSTWGYADTLIWAGNGCRGEFEVKYRRAVPAPPRRPEPAKPVTRAIVCGSYSRDQVTCRTGGYATEVRLTHDYTGSRCRKNTNWGHTDAFIWTKQGCRGDFEVTYRDSLPATGTTQLTCGSAAATQVQCSTGVPASRVRVVRNVGSSQCREGDNWKLSGATILAGNGCRAEFEVTYGRDSTPGMRPMASPTRVISCGNTSGSAMSCNAFGTVATVRLQRDRSGGRCGESGTWGLGNESIWVIRGCYGDFELSYTG